MSVIAISQHECRHVLADAVAMQMLAPDRYHEAEVTVDVSATAGSVVFTVGDPSKGGADFEVSHGVSRLGAVGPCAKATDAADRIMAGELPNLGKECGLSPADFDLLEGVGGDAQRVTLAKVLYGVQALERGLGITGFQRLSKMLRNAVNQHCAHFRLADLVPPHAAVMALQIAQRQAEAAMGATSPAQQVMRNIAAKTAAEAAAKTKGGKV